MPRLLRSTALLALLSASPALADITVDDAWDIWKAQFTAYGLTLQASEAREGDALQIGEITLSASFPENSGSAQISFPGPRFAATGDGRVRITFPETSTASLRGEITGEGSLALAAEVRGTGEGGLMSGNPGDVVTEWKSDGLDVELLDLAVSGEKAVDLTGAIHLSGIVQRMATKITATHVEIEGETGYANYEMTYAFTVPDKAAGDMRMQGGGTGEGISVTQNAALPREGIDPLGLDKQLREGMRLASHVTTARTTSLAKSWLGETLLTDQVTEASDYVVSATIAASGLDYGGSTGAFSARVEAPEIPVPISLSGAGVEARLLMPLLKGEAAQDAALRLAIRDFTLADDLWSLFDPAAALPRDPMTLDMDLTAMAKIAFEFLDFRALLGGAEPVGLPVMVETATLNGFTLKAVGGEITGTGAFTFDYDDWETYPGMPAPEGETHFVIRGANALIGKLVEMGVMKEEEAMPARMGLMMFAKPGEGEDVLVSDIEVKKTGEITANGMRVK